MGSYKDDVDLLRGALSSLPAEWDGREAILELRRRDYNWRQMEWMGFYFEILCRDKMAGVFQIPGQRYGNVAFDCFRSIDWDMKASAIKTDRHVAILNDVAAVDASIAAHGRYGVIMALVDVDYNDDDRTFQKWHSELKGGVSKYEQDRIARNATSRYRKTCAVLRQILFLVIGGGNEEHLGMYAQGRNANGSPRNPKYQLDIAKSEILEVGRIDF